MVLRKQEEECMDYWKTFVSRGKDEVVDSRSESKSSIRDSEASSDSRKRPRLDEFSIVEKL